MTRKQMKQLAKISFDGSTINPTKVSVIAARLKRADMRFYVKALKLYQEEHTVEVTSAVPADQATMQSLELRFPEKKVDYIINKNLLAGMRIVDNDLLYDYSLENKIGKVVAHIYETND